MGVADDSTTEVFEWGARKGLGHAVGWLRIRISPRDLELLVAAVTVLA